MEPGAGRAGWIRYPSAGGPRVPLPDLLQPLYAYIRAQGHGPEESRDLTQGFFTEFLDKDFLSSVDPDKGRFRSFLLASLRHFLSHERDRERALKRGGSAVTLSLDLTNSSI